MVSLYISFGPSDYIFPTEDELHNSELNSYSSEYCDMFIDFIQRIRVLPASEAHSERIFASMRDLVSDNQKSMTAENIRSEAILKLSRIVKPRCPANKSQQKRIACKSPLLSNFISDSSENEDFDELL